MVDSVLVICEKANAARRIAEILSKGSAKSDKMGRVQFHMFDVDGKDFSVIGLRGHIIDIDFPETFRRWSRKRLKEMVRISPEKKVTESGIEKTIQSIYSDIRGKGDVEIIVATDFDREGELIGLEGITVIDHADATIRRARFSALTGPEINRAFSNLEEVDRNLAMSAESRREIDLLWGVILTRFLSLASRQTGKQFLSAGRVQTPTLALINKRESEIKAFDPEPYWVIPVTFDLEGKSFNGIHMAQPFREEEDATGRFAKVKDAADGVVVELSTREKETKAPAPFDTTAFIRAATSLGMQASRAMGIAEELYTAGYISYPRTDNTVYPPSIDLKGIVQMLAVSEHGAEAKYVLEGPMSPTRGKKSTTDHPPIYPVQAATKKTLSGQQWQIYDLIVRRFLATLSPPAKAVTTEARIDVAHEPFISKGYRTTDPGWRRVYPFFKSEETFIPELTKGRELDVKKVSLDRKLTKPPARYSQGNIIQEMEKLGLGTKSTRHEILNKLYTRGYIRGMSIEPTRTESAVIDALSEHATEITESSMTSELEEEMTAIAEGRMTKEEVVDRSRDLLDKVLDTLEEHGEEIGNGIRKVLAQESVIGTCPSCGGTLYQRTSRNNKRFVGCSSYPNCNQTYPLPQYGLIQNMGVKCEHCEAPVIKVINKKRKPWITCVNMECPGRKAVEKD